LAERASLRQPERLQVTVPRDADDDGLLFESADVHTDRRKIATGLDGSAETNEEVGVGVAPAVVRLVVLPQLFHRNIHGLARPIGGLRAADDNPSDGTHGVTLPRPSRYGLCQEA